MAHHIGQRAHKHPHLTMKSDHASERLAFSLISMLDQFQPRLACNHTRQGRKRGQPLGQNRWPGTGAAAAMRRGECFVQVNVHGINAQIPGAHASDNGVEIGAVAIEVATRLMHRIGNGNNIAFKQPACVGIGQHNGGDVIAELVAKRRQINTPVIAGGNFINAEAQERGRRRICAMGRFRHQHPHAPVNLAARLDRGANGHHAA